MYIEITQDGAGLLSSEDPKSGLFTSDVQNCCVYLFKGKNGIAMVHDTGQLLVSGIAEIVKLCGKLEKALYVINPTLSKPQDAKRHRERRKRILALLKWRKNADKVLAISGEVAIDKNGKVFLGEDLWLKVRENLLPLPDKEKRYILNAANNIFLPKNSQSIPPDIQYINGGHTNFPKLLISRIEMERRAEQELERGDRDFRKVLLAAEQSGLFDL